MQSSTERSQFLIISGGQTGADQGGLDAALSVGYPVSGFAPKNWMTTNGPDPSIQTRYNMIESVYGYAGRTRQNIEKSHMTIVVASRTNEGGTKLTIDWARRMGKPCVVVKYDPKTGKYEHEKSIQKVLDTIRFLQYNTTFIINIAGNSEVTCPLAHDFTYRFCSDLFARLQQEYNGSKTL